MRLTLSSVLYKSIGKVKKDSTLTTPSNSKKYKFGKGEVKRLLASPR
jgi:hypothetical protein